MILITFLAGIDTQRWREQLPEVPQKGDTVQLGGKLREVKHRRWALNDDNEYEPELVVS